MVEIRFIIGDDAYISMTFDESLDRITMGTQGKICLWHNNKPIYNLQNRDCSHTLWDALLRSHDTVDAVLKNTLNVPYRWPSVGYMLNEYFENPIRHNPKEDPMATQYLMWSVIQGPATLLYNKDGEIILQIVPTFDSFINKISYKIFIRNYRSYFTRAIPREIAQEWLIKITEIGQTMLDNYYGDKRPYGVKPIFPDKYVEEG